MLSLNSRRVESVFALVASYCISKASASHSFVVCETGIFFFLEIPQTLSSRVTYVLSGIDLGDACLPSVLGGEAKAALRFIHEDLSLYFENLESINHPTVDAK